MGIEKALRLQELNNNEKYYRIIFYHVGSGYGLSWEVGSGSGSKPDRIRNTVEIPNETLNYEEPCSEKVAKVDWECQENLKPRGRLDGNEKGQFFESREKKAGKWKHKHQGAHMIMKHKVTSRLEETAGKSNYMSWTLLEKSA